MSTRAEVRHWNDCKQAYLREDAVEAQRPKRGRPRKVSLDQSEAEVPEAPTPVNSSSENKQSEPSPNLPQNSYNLRPRKIATVDFSIPPPGWPAGNSNSTTPAADPTVAALTLTGPPPMPSFPHKPATWTASAEQLRVINQSIVGSQGYVSPCGRGSG